MRTIQINSLSQRLTKFFRLFPKVVFGMLAFGMPLCSLASGVPTPAPGTGTPITIPAPDPVQYPAMTGTTISSQQFNSTLWKNYDDINAIASALNGCSYGAGSNVASVAATMPLVATIGSCVPGVGTQLTLSLAGGIPPGWIGSGAVATHNITLGSSTNNVGPSGNTGVNCNIAQLLDIASGFVVMCVDNAGNVGAYNNLVAGNSVIAQNDVTAAHNIVFGGLSTGGTCFGASGNCTITGILTALNVVATATLQGANATIAGTMQSAFTNITNTMQAFNANVTNLAQLNNVRVTGVMQQIISGTPFQIPYIAQATSGTGHLEHQIITLDFSLGNPICATLSYNVSFSVRPATFYTTRSNPGQQFTLTDNGSTASQWKVCGLESSPLPSSIDVNAFAIGE